MQCYEYTNKQKLESQCNAWVNVAGHKCVFTIDTIDVSVHSGGQYIGYYKAKYTQGNPVINKKQKQPKVKRRIQTGLGKQGLGLKMQMCTKLIDYIDK